MEKMVWKKMTENAVTQGGDPVWVCPICGRGLHVNGIEHSDNKDKCPDCSIPLRYPWEKE